MAAGGVEKHHMGGEEEAQPTNEECSLFFQQFPTSGAGRVCSARSSSEQLHNCHTEGGFTTRGVQGWHSPSLVPSSPTLTAPSRKHRPSSEKPLLRSVGVFRLCQDGHARSHLSITFCVNLLPFQILRALL